MKSTQTPAVGSTAKKRSPRQARPACAATSVRQRYVGPEAPALSARERFLNRWRWLVWLLIGALAPGSNLSLDAQPTSSSSTRQLSLSGAPAQPQAKGTGGAVGQTAVAQGSQAGATVTAPAPGKAAVAYQEPFYPAPRKQRLARRATAHAAAPAPAPVFPAQVRPASASGRALEAVLRPLPPGGLRAQIQGVPPARLPEPAPARETGAGLIAVETSTTAEVLHLPVGRSMVLSTGEPLRRVYVGDPKVLHSFAPGSREDIITARAPGVSALILWDRQGNRHAYSVFADLDTGGLEKAIAGALPDAKVTVSSNTSRLYLSGTVTSEAAAETVARLAVPYSRDVVDGVRVQPVHSRQIELKLRFVEVDRSKLEELGFNLFRTNGQVVGGTSTQQFPSTATPPTSSNNNTISVSNALNLLLYDFQGNAGVTIQDLEQKHVLQVLAEPTLTTISGVAAHFLSGGEFPLPVVQGGTGNSTAITIVFKPYGVKMDFTPTASPDGTIRLKVAPEVSTLDYSNGVTISGFTIPAVSTRKAETEVELLSGQSFMLSGLLDRRATDAFSKMPGIANLPVLGQLFKSKSVNLSTVDLMVVVTATLVDPLNPAAPAEKRQEPKMAAPFLDKGRFDEDLDKNKRGQSAVPPRAVNP